MKTCVIAIVVCTASASFAFEAVGEPLLRDPFVSPVGSHLRDDGSVYALSDERLQIDKHEALKGSCIAARALYAHYQLARHDHDKAMYWLQIAAENGDPVAQNGLSRFLADNKLASKAKTDEEITFDKERAEFWSKKSLEHPAIDIATLPCPQDRK